MKYCCTRGGLSGQSFERALFTGYTKDGGKLMPEYIPKLDSHTIKSWAKLSYGDIAKKILPLFVSNDEVPLEDIHAIVDRTVALFDIPETVRVVPLNGGLSILELFHGKTLAFKDLALSGVGQFLNYFLEKRQKHITLIVATSGDTGSAAIESVRALKWVDIIVILPKGRCSRIQELQMTTVIEDNVHVFRVDGDCDYIDDNFRRFFKDLEPEARDNISTVNSINWARIVMQIIHYFYGYFQVCPSGEGEMEFVVPTGSCGNITAGYIAKAMGLPVRFTCTVTINDTVQRAFSGDLSRPPHVTPTLAEAMDIGMPYNMERILYLCSDGDTELVRRISAQFDTTGTANIPPHICAKMKEVGSAVRVTDEEIRTAMRRCWAENKYLLCPHTATAVHYYYTSTQTEDQPKMPRLCIATASPAKFERAVKSAGLCPQPTEKFKALETKQTKYTDVEKEEDIVKVLHDVIENIQKSWK